ncbi:MAG: alpha-D-ribose 1-methylphosphonate 5-triphosphate diphosphatase [Desulfosoma sp.]|uniref:alpha-D-ribose 1-methylphosphonate 5-triphosphate diphosphatase n=1 Tax=Desulfosoma sp. TaxID=2603217 RepID=UPI00404A2E7D
MKTYLHGGRLFDGEKLYDGGAGILFDQRGILEVSSKDLSSAADRCVHSGRSFILPGLVDLHCDVLEKCIEMRPGVLFDPQFALAALDRRLATAGITTFCHAVSFTDNELGLRSPNTAAQVVCDIKTFDSSPCASIRHRVHGRFEVGSDQARPIFEDLLHKGLLDLASIMDHTPGQGQFRTLEAFHRYYSGTYKLSQAETESLAKAKIHKSHSAWQNVVDLAGMVRRCHVPLLSHDDDNPAKVQLVHTLGAVGCEFPVSLEAAREAKSRSMAVLVGAPNVLRGASSNSHLSARTAVVEGVADALVSDYYPECLLQAPFLLHRLCGLPLSSALALVTSGPARLLDPHGRCGYLKPGLPADIAVVSTEGPWPSVSQLWVGGRLVYQGRSKSQPFPYCIVIPENLTEGHFPTTSHLVPTSWNRT